jgi:hypothetical protein
LFAGRVQGCQICPGATYQNGENIPNDPKTYQMATKNTKWQQKIPNDLKNILNGYQMYQHIPLQDLSKIYPNYDFCF